MSEKDYRITIRSGHHVVDMKPEANPLLDITETFSESMGRAAEAFLKYFESIPKIR